MRYRVNVKNKEYIIDVEVASDDQLTEEIGNDVALEIVKNEYDHCFDRSSKLDNKVYILLTACAFLFIMLSNAIEKIRLIGIPQGKSQFIVDSGYIVLLTINILLFVFILIKLIKLLRGIELKSFDSFDVLEKNMVRAEKTRVIQYACMTYEKCRDYNNALIESKYRQFNECTKLMVANIILLLIVSLYSSIL